MSPDFNTIYYTWDMLSRCIRQQPYYPQNLNDVLVQRVQIIPQKGTMSIPRRCQECMDDSGPYMLSVTGFVNIKLYVNNANIENVLVNQ